jgi:predicted nucleic acid-binding protein
VISADTSVLVRYLVGTPRAQARAAARLVDSDREIGVSAVALAECAHVLRTQYGVGRADIIDSLIGLVQRQNITVLGIRTEAVVDALVRARSLGGRPVADALIVAAAADAGALPLATFDRAQHRYGIATEEPGADPA